MKKPPKPQDEAARLQTLKDLEILETPIEECFESITRLCSKVLQVPICAISLIDENRQWFKSIHGLDVSETDRDISFCGHAILEDGCMVVENAALDQRFQGNPLVTDEPAIRFYAGQPITAKNGQKLGTLCIIDKKPRGITSDEIDILKGFAKLVQNEINNREVSISYKEMVGTFTEVERSALIDPATRLWNQKAAEKIINLEIESHEEDEKIFGLAVINIKELKNLKTKKVERFSDELVRGIVEKLLALCDRHDSVMRWDDKTFVLLINSEVEAEMHFAIKRLQEELNRKPYQVHNDEIIATSTIGLTYFEPRKNMSAEDLISIAKSSPNITLGIIGS